MANKIQGGSNNAGLVNVDANYGLKVSPEVDIQTNPQFIGAVKIVSENDGGTELPSPYLLSPETDSDFRLRMSLDTPLDDETFNYTAQNTGKHNNQSTTMTYSYTTGGVITNASSITTTTTGLSMSTYAMFSFPSNGAVLYLQADVSFSAQPVANTIVDFGFFLRPTSNPYAPTDGAYFRLTSAGLFGVVNHNGTETTTSVFSSFTYNNSQVYKFIVATSNNRVNFWIDDVLFGWLPTPVTQGQPFMSAALPFSMRHVITGGAAGGVFQVALRGYGVSVCGLNQPRTLGESSTAMYGAYQGLSGGTMGTIGTYTNSTNPTAAVPTNTTAAVGAVGLLNQAWETFSLAVNTDGILLSYQVPAGTVSIPGKRLKVLGVKLSSFVQTVLVGGPIIRQFALAFGHSTVTMAGTEAATTKNRRIVLLPELQQAVTAAQAVSTIISQPGGTVSLFPAEAPVYVNPGEFVAVTVKGIGTVGTSGTIVSFIQLIYSWE